jgi:hypothetical protein
MAFGALKSAEAVARALTARDVTVERISKVFRHLRSREEYRSVYALLDSQAREMLEAMKSLKGHPDW